MVDTVRYKEWFKMGDKDLKSSKILFDHDADYGIICFHCQQAIEKYLKGYLISQTGILQSGHNLFKLCKKAMSFEKSFEGFLKDMTFVNLFYIETRYPADEALIVSKEEVEECLQICDRVIKFILELL